MAEDKDKVNMALRRNRQQCEQLSEFERGRTLGHREAEYFRLRENVRIMQTHEAVVDIIHGRSVGYNLLDIFTDGLGFTNYPSEFVEYVESSEDDDDDDDYDDDGGHVGSQSNRYCGFTPKFLDKTIPKALPAVAFRKVKGVSPEEAAKNAKELVDEEEKLKIKAEKKKQKKMRQRERRRLEKIEKENADKSKDKSKKVNPAAEKPAEKENKKKNKTNNNAPVPPDPDPGPPPHAPAENSEGSDEEADDQESVTEEPEEELDMNSCFVTNAAAIAKRKIEQKPKSDRKDKREENVQKQEAIKTSTAEEPHNKPREGKEESGEIPDFVVKSRVLATTGNEYAAAGNLEMAVLYFTDAIKHNPKEFMLFGNRSFCYEKMQQYERALADADIALSLCPTWIKGLYRKGKALVGLKRYYDASLIYKEVLKLDSCCTDAAQELMRVQIMQLMDMGFTREQSSNALIIHGTVEKALEALSGLQGSVVASPMPSEVSAEEEWEFAERKSQPSQVPLRTVSQNQPRPNTAVKPPPLELFPIWVGDLVPEISQSRIYELFRVFGPVYSVKLLRGSRCAFVNYTNKDHSEKAIQDMHGYAIAGTTLAVRYPDRLHSHLGASKGASTDNAKVTKLPDECHFWRTTGCIKNNRCFYRHVPEHKGIDRAKVKF